MAKRVEFKDKAACTWEEIKDQSSFPPFVVIESVPDVKQGVLGPLDEHVDVVLRNAVDEFDDRPEGGCLQGNFSPVVAYLCGGDEVVTESPFASKVH